MPSYHPQKKSSQTVYYVNFSFTWCSHMEMTGLSHSTGNAAILLTKTSAKLILFKRLTLYYTRFQLCAATYIEAS